MTPALTDLAEEIRTRSAGRARFIVGIAGAPGSGKSTLADQLAALLGDGAAVLPMDGYHLDNDQLRDMGLFERKGAPETFDAAGYAALLRQVRAGGDVAYPTFDRAADRTVPGGGRVTADTRILLAEGNYLLLNEPPWSGLAEQFDMTVRLDVPRAELERRLIARWLDHGLSEQAARARAQGNDLVNADRVIAGAAPADVVLRDTAVGK
ncbi:phosphoribulokinase [Pseudooceanicola onchidii]|uniref:phosphoribulokinase n=1 Tax=Pseudooceanicola onchidii TaxID=2562279 RepID=UPI0010A9B26B|nr:phosphoribulokinase [Pseudooceanicola onchidii]